MVTLNEFMSRLNFWRNTDRLGQDMPLTYWRLFFKSEMVKICNEKFASFGMGSEFRPGAYAEACSKISVGKNIVIRPGTFLFADPSPGGGTITIEDDVLIGSGVHFYTNNHKFEDPNVPILEQGYPPATELDSIMIRKGSWIGAGVIILPGVEIGENAVVGAGSVVTKSIPPRVVACGNPIQILRNLV